MSSLDRIYISEALKELSFKDRRSLLHWCRNNGNLAILHDKGTKKKYLIREEFEAAKSYQAIKYLMEKHDKSEFPAVVQSFINIQSELKVAQYENSRRIKIPEYTPTGKVETIFRNRLRNIIDTV